MLFVASRCWLCRSPLSIARQGICGYCQRQLLQFRPSCPRCGSAFISPSFCLWPLLTGSTTLEPLNCRQPLYAAPLPPIASLQVSPAERTGPSSCQADASGLATGQKHQQQVSKPELLLAVPLSRRRLWRRGFNQSERIARYLSHWLSCPFAVSSLRRQRHTPIQHLLSAAQRRSNLRGAFICQDIPAGSQILLLDDVVTKGSTVAEISRLLLAAGAQSVEVLCLCRTV